MTMKKRMVAVVAAVGAFLGATATALAQTPVTLTDPLNHATLSTVLKNVTTFLQVIGAPIAVIMVLVGAFQMMTSAGEPEKYTKGKTTITWAAIGFAVVLLASGISTLISNILNGH
jgi:exosome complex RNA-binding protein Rrp42 (RNase PH superfamily)